MENLKALFQNVFWPAAAGNVFWSFFTLATSARDAAPDTEAKLAVLFLLAVYLTIEWFRNMTFTPERVDVWYFVFDTLHIWAVVYCAIVAAMLPGADGLPRHANLKAGLYAYFIITAVGHTLGVYRYRGDTGAKQYWLASINFLGVLVLWTGPHLGLAEPWSLPTSFVVVLALWMASGRFGQLLRLLSGRHGRQEQPPMPQEDPGDYPPANAYPHTEDRQGGQAANIQPC